MVNAVPITVFNIAIHVLRGFNKAINANSTNRAVKPHNDRISRLRRSAVDIKMSMIF